MVLQITTEFVRWMLEQMFFSPQTREIGYCNLKQAKGVLTVSITKKKIQENT